MSEKVATPVYLRIALDIASRIARGEFKENSKIYGRSIMSSEYGVSRKLSESLAALRYECRGSETK